MSHKFSITRRHAAALALSGLGTALLPQSVAAQTYPERMIRVIVPFPAGGIVDNTTRALTARLSTAFNQQFLIENKGGAGGTVGTVEVVRAAPDGYTLLTTFDTHAVSDQLYKLSYNPHKDLAPVALIATSPLALVVHPSVPANTVAELVALAKAKPDALNYASTGIGSSNQLTAELFNTIAGIKITHVPYRGGAPAIADIVAGQVQVMFVSVPSVLEHIRAGKLKALAVTTAQRIPVLPDVPTIATTYPGFEVQSWVGMLAPAATPRPIVEKLNASVRAALKTPDLKSWLDAQSLVPVDEPPEAFGRFLENEGRKWSDVIQKNNIRLN